MKFLEDDLMKIIFTAIVVGSLIVGCSYLGKAFNFDPDGPIEELIEEVIEDQLGVDVDLTPESKEERK